MAAQAKSKSSAPAGATASTGSKKPKDYKSLPVDKSGNFSFLRSELSSEIFKHLREDEINAHLEIARLDTVDSEIKEAILEEFQELMAAQNFITSGGIDYAHELLENLLKSKGNRYYQSPYQFFASAPFDFIRRTDPRSLIKLYSARTPANDCAYFSLS